MEPTFPHEDQSSRVNLSRTLFRSEGCPSGTVPIRRTKKEELIRAKTISKSFTNDSHSDPADFAYRAQAYVHLKGFTDTIYRGTQTFINVYAPKVRNNARNTGQVWVENEDNHLQVGWGVLNDIYHDGLVRFFGYWSNGGNTGCFNTFCPGFVHTDPNYRLGRVIHQTSSLDGNQYDINVQIRQDLTTGNWWLRVPDSNVNVGYWPKSLFTKLSAGASKISWGGAVGAPANTEKPQMGSGLFPDGNYRRACHFSQIKVFNKTGDLINPDSFWMKTYSSDPKCYTVQYYKDQGKGVGHTSSFGGPGGDC